MTHATFVARLSAVIPHCRYCDEPGLLRGETEFGAAFQCQNPHCRVRGSWTVPVVVETTGELVSEKSGRAA